VDYALVDRRSAARYRHAWLASVRATLRPGRVIELVEVSTGGALVHGSRPLRPGAWVHLQLTTELQSTAMPALVLRCAVWAVDPHQGIIYQGALKFGDRCDWSADIRRFATVSSEALQTRPVLDLPGVQPLLRPHAAPARLPHPPAEELPAAPPDPDWTIV
jgi:hypothetical protein